jgi:AraC-like DNA-binding protein
MFLSVVYFITGLLGFLTFTVMITQYKTNRKVNFYFLVLLLFTSIRFFFNGVEVLVSFSIDKTVVLILRSFGCAVFPCIYLYFRNLIIDKKDFGLGDLRFFSIPVLFGFANLLSHEYTAFLHVYFYFLFSGISLFYLLLVYFELKNKVWFNNSQMSIVDDQKKLIRNWTIFFFAVCVLSILRLLFTLFLDIWVAGYSDGTTYLWMTAIISCVLFFKVLFTPDVLHSYPVRAYNLKNKECYDFVFNDFWILSNEVVIHNREDLKLKERVELNLLNYIHEVEWMALKRLCFREPSVSLGDFAIKLGIPKTHLIYLFKYHAIVSFVEFKKAVQIYDSIGLIEEGYLQSKTLKSLSKKTGFSSYDPFLISFKEVTGVVPQEYEKMMK